MWSSYGSGTAPDPEATSISTDIAAVCVRSGAAGQLRSRHSPARHHRPFSVQERLTRLCDRDGAESAGPRQTYCRLDDRVTRTAITGSQQHTIDVATSVRRMMRRSRGLICVGPLRVRRPRRTKHRSDCDVYVPGRSKFFDSPLSMSGVVLETTPSVGSAPRMRWLHFSRSCRRRCAPSPRQSRPGIRTSMKTVGSGSRLLPGRALSTRPIDACSSNRRRSALIASGESHRRLRAPAGRAAHPGQYLLTLQPSLGKQNVERDVRFSVRGR
jgi:hypothetical protein